MRSVATFLCSLCFVFYTSFITVRADHENLPTSCLEKAGITLAEIPSLLGDNSDEGTRKRGCVEACYMQKIGIMDGNTLVVDRIDEMLSNNEVTENIRESVHRCATDASDADECKVAAKFAECGLDGLRSRLRDLFHR
ncbi:odorant binding protein 4 [Ptiloglossa arizonensis]|uniref:odorant binding protein 4 n=1 Tax=Ptiloglossa arizonensis TaxID=3350558 RepID=UPI003F9FC908